MTQDGATRTALAAMLSDELASLRDAAHEEGYARGHSEAMKEAREKVGAAIAALETAEHRGRRRPSPRESAQLRKPARDIVAEVFFKLAGSALATREAIVGVVAEVLEARTRGARAAHPRESARPAGVAHRRGRASPPACRAASSRWCADARVEAGGCMVESALGSLDGRLEVQLAGLLRDVARREGPGGARMSRMHASSRSSMRGGDWVRRIGRIVRFVGLTLESTRARRARRRDLRDPCARPAAASRWPKWWDSPSSACCSCLSATCRASKSAAKSLPPGAPPTWRSATQLLGRVIDGFGQPLDGAPLDLPATRHPLYPPPLNPLHRGMVREVLETGIRAIDTLLTLGRGQRVGIFAGSGVGKSTVLGMLAREVKADVSVIALIGERGREVRAFVEEGLSAEARATLGGGRRDFGSAAAGAASRGLSRHRHRRTFSRRRAQRLPDHGFDHARRHGAARDRPGRAASCPPRVATRRRCSRMLPRLLERGGVAQRAAAR